MIFFISSFSTISSFFVNILIFFLIFNNSGKSEHIPTWETLCNRKTFIEVIMWFSVSKRLVFNIWVNLFKYTSNMSCLIERQLIHWKLQTLVNYCIYLNLYGNVSNASLNFQKFTSSIHYCYFLKQSSWKLRFFLFFKIIQLIWYRI